MKQFISTFLIVAAVLFCFPSFAQDFRGGFAAGLNTSNVTGTQSPGIRQFGLNAGVFVENDFNEDWAFRMEFLFSQKGARKLASNEDPTFYLLRLNYVEIPLLFLYRQNQFNIEFGTSINYLVNYYQGNEHGETLPISPFNSFDFPFVLGINYQLTRNLDMNWRFSHSLFPMAEHFRSPIFWHNRGHNQVLSFRIIYLMDFSNESSE